MKPDYANTSLKMSFGRNEDLVCNYSASASQLSCGNYSHAFLFDYWVIRIFVFVIFIFSTDH